MKWNASQHFHTIHLSQYLRQWDMSILLVLVFLCRPTAEYLQLFSHSAQQNINPDCLPPAEHGEGEGGYEVVTISQWRPNFPGSRLTSLHSPVFTRRSVPSSQSAVDRRTVNISRPARPRQTIGNGFLTNFQIIFSQQARPGRKC